MTTQRVAGAGVAVAEKSTVAAPMPGAVALRPLGPATCPSVQLLTAAMPEPSVIATEPFTQPPPEVTENIDEHAGRRGCRRCR